MLHKLHLRSGPQSLLGREHPLTRVALNAGGPHGMGLAALDPFVWTDFRRCPLWIVQHQLARSCGGRRSAQYSQRGHGGRGHASRMVCVSHAECAYPRRGVPCRQVVPQHSISRVVLGLASSCSSGLANWSSETKNAQHFSHVGGDVKIIVLTHSAQCRYEQTGGRIYVCEIVPNSPADESREIRVGDILLSVDGQRVQGMQLDSVNRLIAGPVGSSVNVEFQHEDGSTSRTSLTRREVYRR
jgi:hypothetical protein